MSTAVVVAIVIGAVVLLLIVVACYDITQKKHTIMHNFPVIGHLRYWLESIGPEMRQYFVAHDKEEMPFNRDERRWIYASAKGANNNFGFGTTEQVYGIGYPIIKHAAFPFPEDRTVSPDDDPTTVPCAKVMGAEHGRRRPFRPMSVINIAAMSFGALSDRAIMSLNRGAADAGCYHNTGEGGISPYHLQGAELIWQLGTGYFGARNEDGFSWDVFREKIAEYPQVRAIEIKLSQGAKPCKGGILPGAKVSAEIAATRGIPQGKDCISPSAHAMFDDVPQLIDFVERLADESGLPVGIKSAVGHLDFWQTLAQEMKTRRAGPDFFSIDGGEGGTGAAPLTFADHVSVPFKIGFGRVYRIFAEAGLANSIVWIGSAKLGFPGVRCDPSRSGSHDRHRMHSGPQVPQQPLPDRRGDSEQVARSRHRRSRQGGADRPLSSRLPQGNPVARTRRRI